MAYLRVTRLRAPVVMCPSPFSRTLHQQTSGLLLRVIWPVHAGGCVIYATTSVCSCTASSAEVHSPSNHAEHCCHVCFRTTPRRVQKHQHAPLYHTCQVLLIALLVGILRVIYFLAVRATRATGSAGDAAPTTTGDSWNAAQAADAPSENSMASKVHQASSITQSLFVLLVCPVVCFEMMTLCLHLAK